MKKFLLILIGLCAGAGVSALAAEQTSWSFQFGPGPRLAGAIDVASRIPYTTSLGYGYEPSGGRTATALPVDQPFIFSMAVPEGLYRVTVVLGEENGPSRTTIKAEARRWMVERVETPVGRFETRTFTVAVRRPALRNGDTVRLKRAEVGHPDWDEKLSLEFCDEHPRLVSLQVAPATDVTTVFIAGDSTVTDQPREPYVGWGQMLPRFLQPNGAVSNLAESGESIRSSVAARRFEKIFELMKPGDYLLVQFGHNDQKDKSPGAGPYTSYKEGLRSIVMKTRARGGLPVIVTSMERRHFEGSRIVPSLADFAEAARQLSREENVPLIDLHAMSIQLYEALGPEESTKAFVHFPAGTFPGQSKALKDDTHFTAYGGYELARCVVEGMRMARLKLVDALADDMGHFDPAQPDPWQTWSLPASAQVEVQKPAGN